MVGSSQHRRPLLTITYFTDPLCCWSWGFEPQVRRLRYGFAGRIAWRVRMVGLIGDWNTFSDPLNDVHRPVQMGPVWIQCSTDTGVPIEPSIWARDPPASSWPACLAVRAAGLQSAVASDLLLRRLREGSMIEGRNIARQEVLIEIARRLEQDRPDCFDANRFQVDLEGREARAALQRDVREARFHGVARFPCLGLQRSGAEPIWMIGWRPWNELLKSVQEAATDLGPERRPADADAYAIYWNGATEREIAVALGEQTEAAIRT